MWMECNKQRGCRMQQVKWVTAIREEAPLIGKAGFWID